VIDRFRTSSGARPLGRAEIEAAYRKHGHSVLRRALHLLGSESEAKEVLQEVFASLLEHPAQFEGRSALLTWLYSTTTHRCLNRLRTSRTRTRLAENQPETLFAPSQPCAPDRGLELRRLLMKLPEELVAVAVWHHLDALTYEETASMMGCSRRKVAYLIAELREYVKNEETTDAERIR
jgi:RNA polymerase sigma factor (sigma-70 family)